MTNEATRTMTFVAAAVVLTALALWAGPSRDVPPIFDDKGQEFFPGFTDPTKPVALEIMEFDSDTAELRPFKVQFKNGRWSIPSHYDYPADAKDRMAEAAGLFVGLTKDDIRSDDPADHALYGVGDPMEQSLDLEGRGTKVTFKDSNGNDMASLILGKAVEGREGFRYVRYPDKKRTYSAKLPAEVSTKFGDWIEKDLLQLSSADLHRMSFDAYSVDEVTFNITPGEKLVADKKDLDWVVEGLSDSEETNKDALRTAASTLDQLEIVGVRTKPPGLTGQLTRAEGIQMSQENVFSLQSKGFFLTRDGTLKANEGDLLLDTKGGIGYKLSFGEVLYGEGDAVTAGGGDETASGGDAGADGAARTGVANRYLMVTARFDESLLDRPEKGEPLPDEHLEKRKAARTEIEKIVRAVKKYQGKEGDLPGDLAALTAGDEPVLEELKKDPWDRDYVLEIREEKAPVATSEDPGDGTEAEPEVPVKTFVVSSLGEDGEKGGDGTGQDIASDDWSRESDLQAQADDWKEFQETVEAGKTASEKLSRRFAPWYYVISDDSFKKIRLDRAQLVKAKAAVQEGENFMGIDDLSGLEELLGSDGDGSGE